MQGSFRELEPYTLSGIQVTDRELGRGSYAAVVEIEYRGLKCAGKKIYQAISQQGLTYSLRRFAEECRLLSQMRHPNVVQFLGVHLEDQEAIPILVMEYLPTNLSSCIDEYGILPKEINYSILHNVSLGLSYLHNQTPPIIHRDLSANNVLLTSNMMAKISDLGVARIINLTPLQMSRMTETPGTPSYMPPEVMVADPKYNTSVDIFSYGIMMIHVFSGEWPHPKLGPTRTDTSGQLVPVSEAERREEYLRTIVHDHPLMDLILKCINNHPPLRGNVSEIVQRLKDAVVRFPPSFANKVEMLSRIESLEEEKKGLVTDSEQKDDEIEQEQKRVQIMEKEIERLEIAHSTEVEHLRLEMKDVTTQMEMITIEKHVIENENQSLTRTIERERQVFREATETQQEVFETEKQALQQSIETEREIYRNSVQQLQKAHTDDIQKLQLELDAVKARSENVNLKVEKSQLKAALASKEQEVATVNVSLSRKDSEIASKKTALTKKDDQIKSLNDYLTKAREYLSSKPHVQAKITWTQCADLPMPANHGQTTVINKNVYFGGFAASTYKQCRICCYNYSQDTWSTLPRLPVWWFGLGQVRGQVVAVGGRTRIEVTNVLYTLDERSNSWVRSLPSMPTARHSPTVVSHPSALIVVGGTLNTIYNEDIFTDVVEIFNTETSEWLRVCPLPAPCCDMSSVIGKNTFYLVGGCTRKCKDIFEMNQVLYTPVEQLLHNATPLNQASPHTTPDTQVWKQLADTPTYSPTATMLGETVLSIGGCDARQYGKAQSAVYMNSPSTDSWIYISDLPAPRLSAATAVLSPTEILVIGGEDDNGLKKTALVYRGTLSL